MFSTQQYSGFDPRSIPGCALWLDAGDSNTFSFSSGSNISQWNDKSGNGRHAVGNTGTGTYSSNGLNSRPTVQITATGNMRAPVAAGTFPSGIILYVVYQKTGANNSFESLVTRTTGAIGDPIDIWTSDVQTSRVIGRGPGNYWQGYETTTSVTRRTTPTVISMAAFSATTNVWTESINGTVSTYTLNTNIIGSPSYGDNATQIYIGTRADGVTLMNGSISEIIAYSATSNNAAQRQQVEGYLAWKWGIQTSLPTGHPFTPNPPAMRIFQPIDISGCGLWYDGADPSTITGTTTVTAWNDKSGNSRHATTTSNHPSYTPGTNYIQFSGSNWMSFPGTFLSNTQYTLFYTVKRDVSKAEMILMSSTDSTTNANLHIGYTPNSATMSYRQWANQFDFAVPAFTTQATEPNNVFCFQQNATQRLAFLNGTQVGSNNNSTLVLANNDALLGVYFRSPTTSWNGRFYEVIMYPRALTGTERQQVEGYLATKWGSSSLLPSTQPFYLQRALPSTPLFTPTALSNCALWLDALDNSRITTSRASVTSVLDKAQNITLTTQGTSSFLTVATNTINGRQSLYFNNSTADNVHLSGTLNNITSGTMLLVFRAETQSSTSFRPFFTWTSTGGLNLPAFGYTTAGANVISPYTTFVGGGTPTNTVTVGSSYTTFYSWSGTTTNVGINGTTPTTGSQPGYGSTNSTVRICWDNGQTTTTYLGELILFSRVITPTERQQMEGYLAWKWGLQNSLPTTHPYYKFRP